MKKNRAIGADRTDTTPLAKGSPLEQAVAATVEIVDENGTGCGFVVDESGLVISARHVVEGDNGHSRREVQVRLFPGLKNEYSVKAEVFRSHRALDYALLWLEPGRTYPAVPMGEPSVLRHGDSAFAIGSPAGYSNTLTRGVVSNPRARIGGVEYIQTDAAIFYGNSGGPLADEQGRAIGIASWGEDEVDAANFAIPLDYLLDDIAAALAQGREACLAATYCPACGSAENHESQASFCRNCGFEFAPRA